MPIKDLVATRTRSRTAKAPAKGALIQNSPVDKHPTTLSSQESSPPKPSSRKRKRDPKDNTADSTASMQEERKKSDPKDILADLAASMQEERKKKVKAAGTDTEKRLRSFRSRAPQSYQQKLERALSQR